jgi:hypothetical protein
MGAEAASTIGLFGTAGIAARRDLLGRIDPNGSMFKGTMTAFRGWKLCHEPWRWNLMR